MATIHASAIIDPKAQLADNVVIGPYAVIGPHVSLGSGCSIGSHSVIEGHTTLGRDNRIGHFAAIGGEPQDMKYRGEPTQLIIGDRNTIREFTTIHTGTAQDQGITRIGNDNWIMAYVHIAHDCQIGSNTIMANATQLAGHVVVGDWAILGGITGVHQFVKIGAHAMTGAGTTLLQDLPPYVMATGNPASAHGINTEGLRRRGFTETQIASLRKAYKLVYKSGSTLASALEQLGDPLSTGATSDADAAAIALFSDFLAASTRGIVR